MMNSAPSWGVGTSQRVSRDERLKTEAPGPGAYEYREKMLGPKWGFTGGKKDSRSNQNSPGPGDYSLPPMIGTIKPK